MSDSRINRARGVALEDLDVVVVDDSRPMQTIVRSILGAARVHRVRTFDQAGPAYRAMRMEPPHLLITDWNLPDSDGLTLVHSLRDPRSGVLAAVPAILITGHATRELVEKAIAAGVHYVLAKPLSPSSVLKRVAAAVADERRFRYDETRGTYVLEGADALLAGQKQRWHDIQGGTRPRPVAGPAPVPAPQAESARATAAGATRPARPRRRGFGFDAPLHPITPETSTGQAPPAGS